MKKYRIRANKFKLNSKHQPTSQSVRKGLGKDQVRCGLMRFLDKITGVVALRDIIDSISK